ncbi:hypothetical protein SAMN05428945_6471 [Streptomyces sp. 2224.1]|nr:hypothetical protein BX261_6061 [Streptomyces sp. 2321.6]SDQ99569.1 hypothetical protein SAMN05216511_1194 [Streptomyces sp. KS_16]SED85464.1 hypothetical protein SAMN05428940_6087 [Streptomyces sp. 2133.1]SED86319.1 hypothetical protein SAMN05428954_1187 [Streptomyces sp. 2112.3]SEE03905.1 hypothetical protein SAMN05428945_6471 [Streptomyces sp. 2224.1]SNC72877.1 hypothetical protein SAMN06272741_5987 [Streptomyces sp. 2114.4]
MEPSRRVDGFHKRGTEAEWSVHLRVFKEGNEVKWTENVQQTQQAGPLAPNYRVTTSGRPCWGERAHDSASRCPATSSFSRARRSAYGRASSSSPSAVVTGAAPRS